MIWKRQTSLALGVLALGFLTPFNLLSQSVVSFTPERIQSLKLQNDEILTGRIVEISNGKIHLVGPGINTMVSISSLSEETKETLGLANLNLEENGDNVSGLNKTKQELTQNHEQRYGKKARFSDAYPAYSSPRFFYSSSPFYPYPYLNYLNYPYRTCSGAGYYHHGSSFNLRIKTGGFSAKIRF